MSPVVGGIAGGVGTTTVAHLVGGHDIGVIDADGAQPVDVLVTRARAVVVGWAVHTARLMPVAPVLVVVADSQSSRWPRVVEQRLRMAESNLATPVLRLRWAEPLAASDNPWNLLATAVLDPDRKKYRWADQARTFRTQLLAAITARDRGRGLCAADRGPPAVRAS